MKPLITRKNGQKWLKLLLIISIILWITISNFSIYPSHNKKNTEFSPESFYNAPGNFHSSIINDSFKIYVDLPEGYNSNDGKNYPTIFLIDGDWYFDGLHWRAVDWSATGHLYALNYRKMVPESILVGIGYPDDNMRRRDFLCPAVGRSGANMLTRVTFLTRNQRRGKEILDITRR